MKKLTNNTFRFFTILSLLIANMVTFTIVSAHNLSCGTRGLHWDRWGTPDIYVYRTTPAGDNSTQAQNATAEWTADTVLDLFSASSHTDVSLYDFNYGSGGPGGQTTFPGTSGCHITHAHATANSYYVNGYTSLQKRALYCHELGHAWGLDHMGSIDECLAAGTYVNSHSITDMDTKYSSSHTSH